jgi:purine-cytosine permease-like protein
VAEVSGASATVRFLLLVFIPWSAVNLTDYLAVRHGRNDVAFFDPDGGPTAKVAWWPTSTCSWHPAPARPAARAGPPPPGWTPACT